MSKRFQSASLLWWITIPGAFIVIFLVAYYPSVLPLSSLQFLLNYRTTFRVIFWATVVAHLFEAMYARRICYKLQIDENSTNLWTIQTFILGYPSLSKLQRYEKQKK